MWVQNLCRDYPVDFKLRFDLSQLPAFFKEKKNHVSVSVEDSGSASSAPG